MTKFTHDDVLDAALAKIATATRYTVCSTAPANFAGIAAVALAETEIDSGDFGSPSNGSPDGRSMAVAAQNDLEVDESGTSGHVALDDGSTLLHVTETTSQALTEGNTVSTSAFTINFRDPT